MSHAAMDDAIDYLLECAKESRLDLEVLANERKSTGIAFQKNKMDQFSFSETHQLGVRVLDGKHEGLAYTESLDRESLDQVLKEARTNARAIEKDWISELHSATNLPELKGMYNPQLEEVAVKEKIANAQQLEAAALEFDPAITAVAYTRYSDMAGTVWIANSKGLRGSYRQNFCSGYTYCLAKDGENNVMGGEVGYAQSMVALNASDIARKAAAKALARRGAVRPKTGSYTVVFENRAAETLIGLIGNYFNAKAVDENTSPLKGKLGQKIFSDQITLMDDPSFVAATGCRPFDAEGYAAQKTTLVERGVVKSFLTNSVLARKLNLPHTASASRAPASDLDIGTSNMLVRPGTSSFADLLNSDKQVLLVSTLNGLAGFRAASGDFSIPMEGSLYLEGKLSAPLKDFLISGNILELFASVEAVGNDVLSPIGDTVCPSLLIRGLNVTGQS